MATIDEAFASAVRHQQAGSTQAAEAIYRQIIAEQPRHAYALSNLGVILNDRGCRDEAASCYRAAIEAKPDYAAAWNNLAVVLRAQGKLDDSIACCRRAAELIPRAPEPYNNLGLALKDQGKPHEAIAAYRRSLDANPDYAEAHNNLGIVFKEQDQFDEAIACYRRALALKPNYTEALANLGGALKDSGQIEEAVACCRRALELRPGMAELHSNLVYSQVFCPGYDASTLYQEHRQWNLRHGSGAPGLAEAVEPHVNDRNTERRLRIGYVSPDFRDHVTGRYLLPLFREHDRARFEIYCYADVRVPDEFTGRLQACVDRWLNSVGLSDAQLAARIREDEVDILVDLTMHMAYNRLLVFARRPAPVQVTFAAYPGTTGLTTIDYRLTDPHLDPPGMFDRYYAEESVRLPGSFWCYDATGDEPPVNALPAAEKGYVTFGCLNNFCKVNASVLKLWAKVMRAVDRSRLIVLAGEGEHRRRTRDLLAAEDIASDRVIFVSRRPRPGYLQYYHGIDISLDTVPYNGHTTSLDSLFMGVPVVTLIGPTVVGRAGLSQLTNLGLPELIAASPEQYVGIAAELASDVSRLSGLRASLRERMKSSPLMDAKRFARNIEDAYRAMWRRWCERE